MHRTVLAFLIVQMAACSPGPRVVPSASPSASVSAALVTASASASALPIDYTLTMSPELQGIVKEARDCKIENDNFVDCIPNIRWTMANRALLLGPENDALVFEMVFDPDEKVRLLGVERPYLNDSPIFKDPKSLDRLMARIPVEPNRLLRASMAFMVGEIDAATPGFAEAMLKLAANPEASVRSSLARGLAINVSPTKVTELEALQKDPDTMVQREATASLASGSLDAGQTSEVGPHARTAH